jgi:hypothetical protein
MLQWCTAEENAKLLVEQKSPSQSELHESQLNLSQLHINPGTMIKAASPPGSSVLESKVERQAKRKRQVSCVPEPDEIPARAVPRFIDLPLPYAKP